MGIRAAHGKGSKALARVETMPAHELPVGVPDEAPREQPGDRDAMGRFRPGNGLAGLGGKGKAGRTKLASSILGVAGLTSDPAFAPYKRSAEVFRRSQSANLAATVGGGVCGPGPSSIIASAALALAASRYLYDSADGDPSRLAQAAKLADSSRQALLTAHELAAREAVARKALADRKPPAALLEALGVGPKPETGGTQ